MAIIPVIGIDLGTTDSCMGVFRNGKVEIIPNLQGNRTIPNYVAFTKIGRLIGHAAKNRVAVDPSNTVFHVNRLIGRQFKDSILQSDKKHWPFLVVSDDGKPKIKVTDKGVNKTFSSEEILSMILIEMKETAEAYLGTALCHAVITVPIYFNHYQRQAIKDAATIAGLNVLRIINGSTAAGIAYGFNRKGTEEYNVLIFDLGGDTCDVSILSATYGIYEIKSNVGKSHIGGDEFDNHMVNHFVQEFEHKHKKDLSTNELALGRLRIACENAKKTLSSNSEVSIKIDSLIKGHNFNSTITRAKFEELNADLFCNALELVEKALQDASLDRAEIDEIVLVGGSTRIPKIRKLLQDFFNGRKLNASMNADESAAFGATVMAAILNGDKSKQLQELLLLDATSHSLGIEELEIMSVVVKRNCVIPTRLSKIITTDFDNQPAVKIRIFEGERTMTKDNNFLGEFELTGIAPAPRGTPQIEVIFDINANSVLTVSAVDKSSGNEHQIIITEGRFSREEIDKMVQDTKKYKDEQNAKIVAKNVLESYALNIKSTIVDNKLKDKISEVLTKVNDTLRWLENNPFAEKREFDRKQKELQVMWSLIIANLCHSVGGATSPGGACSD